MHQAKVNLCMLVRREVVCFVADQGYKPDDRHVDEQVGGSNLEGLHQGHEEDLEPDSGEHSSVLLCVPISLLFAEEPVLVDENACGSTKHQYSPTSLAPRECSLAAAGTPKTTKGKCS